MFAKLDELEKKYADLSDKINDPDIIADNQLWRKLMKEHSDITPIIENYKKYKEIKNS
ncbi:MAG: PCRF domain-containing protein, partial [Firmicutes bacterium]|nr:PCRF domain-containing protein [Bacillota bacterium]